MHVRLVVMSSDHEELRGNYTSLLQQRDGSGADYRALQEKYQALQAEVRPPTNQSNNTSESTSRRLRLKVWLWLWLTCVCCVWHDLLQHAQMEEHAHELAEIAELYMQDHSATGSTQQQAPTEHSAVDGSGLAGLLQMPQLHQQQQPEAQRQWQPQPHQQPRQPMREGLQPTYSMPVMGQQQQQQQSMQQQQQPQWSGNARTMSAYAGAPGGHAAAGRGDR